MANLQQIMNEEIRRLARKELKAQITPAQKTISDLKLQVRELRNQVKLLNEQLLKQQASNGCTVPVQEETSPAEKQIRLTGARILACRKKLGLSRKDFADLIGTTFVSVSNWETGKTIPRLSQKKKIVAIRDMGKRELAKLLAEKKAQAPKAASAEAAPDAPAPRTETAAPEAETVQQ